VVKIKKSDNNLKDQIKLINNVWWRGYGAGLKRRKLNSQMMLNDVAMESVLRDQIELTNNVWQRGYGTTLERPKLNLQMMFDNEAMELISWDQNWTYEQWLFDDVTTKSVSRDQIELTNDVWQHGYGTTPKQGCPWDRPVRSSAR